MENYFEANVIKMDKCSWGKFLTCSNLITFLWIVLFLFLFWYYFFSLIYIKFSPFSLVSLKTAEDFKISMLIFSNKYLNKRCIFKPRKCNNLTAIFISFILELDLFKFNYLNRSLIPCFYLFAEHTKDYDRKIFLIHLL